MTAAPDDSDHGRTPLPASPERAALPARFAVAAAVVYAMASLWAVRDYWIRGTLIDDDARMHLLPFVAARHPEAFVDRLMVDYAAAYLPVGYRALLHTFTPITDPLLVSKALGLGLLLVLWGAAFAAGRQVGGLVGGALALALTAHSDFLMLHTSGGLYRGFGFALAMLWAATRAGARDATDRLVPSTWLVAGMALLYPPVALVCGLALAAELLPSVRTVVGLPRSRLLSVGAAGVVATFALLAVSAKPASLGEVVTIDHASAMPGWSVDGGRLKLLPFPAPGDEVREGLGWALRGDSEDGAALAPAVVKANERAGNPYALWFTLALLPLALLAARHRRWWLSWILAAVVVYLVARGWAFRLGFPDRALKFSMPMLLILLPAMAIAGSRRLKRPWPRAGMAWVIVVWLGVWLAYPIFPGTAADHSIDVGPDVGLLAAVAELPPGALITGWPDGPAENIPLMAGRELWVDHEHALPLYLDYYAEIQRRTTATLELIYATSVEEAAAWTRRHPVTHLVVTPELYAPDEDDMPSIPRPFRERAAALRSAADGHAFLFADPPSGWVAHEDEHVWLIDLRSLRDGQGAATR